MATPFRLVVKWLCLEFSHVLLLPKYLHFYMYNSDFRCLSFDKWVLFVMQRETNELFRRGPAREINTNINKTHSCSFGTGRRI